MVPFSSNLLRVLNTTICCILHIPETLYKKQTSGDWFLLKKLNGCWILKRTLKSIIYGMNRLS